MVDVIGYLSLDHLFTAHMSGNTASLGAALGTGDTRRALAVASPLLPFVGGVALGAWTQERFGTASRRALLTLEGVLLLLFIVVADARIGPWARWAGVGLLAVAMGVQTTIVRRVGAGGVRTTFVTGMLANGMEEVIARCCARGRTPRASLVLHLGLWVIFATAACLGGALAGRWGATAALLPAGLVLTLATVVPRPAGTGRLQPAP